MIIEFAFMKGLLLVVASFVIFQISLHITISEERLWSSKCYQTPIAKKQMGACSHTVRQVTCVFGSTSHLVHERGHRLQRGERGPVLNKWSLSEEQVQTLWIGRWTFSLRVLLLSVTVLVFLQQKAPENTQTQTQKHVLHFFVHWKHWISFCL